MANADFNEARVIAGFAVVSQPADNSFQLEKISCSMATLSEPELLDLRGKRIKVVQHFQNALPDERFIARVLAVHLPASDSGVETSLLLIEDGHGADSGDYVDVADLTLLEQL